MDTSHYLDIFQNAVNRLDKKPFVQKHLELKVGIWLNSVVLKIQKPSWLNDAPRAKPCEESVCFSAWMGDDSIRDSKLLYNIHALKLRKLNAYSIKSRDFAEGFRTRFKPFEKDWPNVSVQLGPLTLMEGFVKIDINHFEHEIIGLAARFLSIEFIIDELLAERRKNRKLSP
jgi:hypothetical protein